MLVLGPIIFGFILGLILGSQVKKNPESGINFTISSFVVILIAGIVAAWQIGQFPFYNDLPIATAFVSALIGILIGKILFARGSAN
ncbi:MAG: energy-converting hydrogenase B subunit J [Methanobrevibacter sp.]|uniref:energy-converting hydrogenase B subunit J n=1 Tax=Methanobrevibacter sp. TaxID=66852 RepID=UPI0026E0D24A|nr:energy-converting hydrogenase B subunit J [Methanobrevibacter sp.]MDO5848076.1 energy-converting hydrogenase B subunit J [Methanobrevibacter sp.]